MYKQDLCNKGQFTVNHFACHGKQRRKKLRITCTKVFFFPFIFARVARKGGHKSPTEVRLCYFVIFMHLLHNLSNICPLSLGLILARHTVRKPHSLFSIFYFISDISTIARPVGLHANAGGRGTIQSFFSINSCFFGNSMYRTALHSLTGIFARSYFSSIYLSFCKRARHLRNIAHSLVKKTCLLAHMPIL